MSAVAASLLVASAMAGGSASSAKGGTLRVNHSLSDYEYVDPQKCYDTGCSEILWPTMYNLMQYPEKSGAEGKRVYPEAATGKPVVSKDGKTYTFTVRGRCQGVQRQDGHGAVVRPRLRASAEPEDGRRRVGSLRRRQAFSRRCRG